VQGLLRRGARDVDESAFTGLDAAVRRRRTALRANPSPGTPYVNIVSIAPFMPFRGIPHAGGEFYRRHAELAARSHEVLIVTPRNSENELAIAHDVEGPYQRLLVGSLTVHGRLRKAHDYVLSRVAPFLAMSRVAPFMPTRPFWNELLSNAEALAALRKADCIELQWFNAVVLAPKLRRLFPDTRIVGVFHDVVSQGQSRMLRARSVTLRWRLVALAQLLLAVPLEQRVLRALDTAVVLSEKDRALLTRRSDDSRIVVVSPPLDDEDMPDGPQLEPLGRPEVLFVGALSRYENDDAARWLLCEIWPQVLGEVPDARLTIAGAEPSPALRQEAERFDDVELTGYVPSLSLYYQRAAVVVAPMRLGAGVKLKSVIAMMWGLPIVATHVGAEGVPGQQVFVAVEDESEGFSKAVVDVLKDPSSAYAVRARAYTWSQDTYSTARYLQSLKLLYSSQMPDREQRFTSSTDKNS
jgi:glycosyltransferase involved in cell wall biosynthesis